MNGESVNVIDIRSKVKLFETLAQTQDDQILISAVNKKPKPVFQRSRTSINLIEATCKSDSVQTNVLRSVNSNKLSRLSRQTDDIKRASIKRSPAFRSKTGDRASKLHSGSPPSSIETRRTSSSEGPNTNLTDTLKKALKQPLPKGPPPRKPKRTFETNIKELIYVDSENKALPKTLKTSRSTNSPSASSEPEPVYMDPCMNHVTSECCKHTNNSKDLHYMVRNVLRFCIQIKKLFCVVSVRRSRTHTFIRTEMTKRRMIRYLNNISSLYMWVTVKFSSR